jgi:S-disulfanyl-L-cysteine oxidoreductase SoxD
VATGWAQAQGHAYPGIGRAATPKEVAAWDIDVRPDFKGLPQGQGSVTKGQDVWESKCASCHGVFGESNEVFTPLVGGTTAADVKTGRVARLTDAGFPGRTTLMKVGTVSTLWDYINRALECAQVAERRRGVRRHRLFVEPGWRGA